MPDPMSPHHHHQPGPGWVPGHNPPPPRSSSHTPPFIQGPLQASLVSSQFSPFPPRLQGAGSDWDTQKEGARHWGGGGGGGGGKEDQEDLWLPTPGTAPAHTSKSRAAAWVPILRPPVLGVTGQRDMVRGGQRVQPPPRCQRLARTRCALCPPLTSPRERVGGPRLPKPPRGSVLVLVRPSVASVLPPLKVPTPGTSPRQTPSSAPPPHPAAAIRRERWPCGSRKIEWEGWAGPSPDPGGPTNLPPHWRRGGPSLPAPPPALAGASSSHRQTPAPFCNPWGGCGGGLAQLAGGGGGISPGLRDGVWKRNPQHGPYRG